MNVRQLISENFAGDLEYRPRRAAVYLLLGAASLVFWYFFPAQTKFTAVPLVFLLGALTLIPKGVFLLRKSSEGLGMSDQELAALSERQRLGRRYAGQVGTRCGVGILLFQTCVQGCECWSQVEGGQPPWNKSDMYVRGSGVERTLESRARLHRLRIGCTS